MPRTEQKNVRTSSQNNPDYATPHVGPLLRVKRELAGKTASVTAYEIGVHFLALSACSCRIAIRVSANSKRGGRPCL